MNMWECLGIEKTKDLNRIKSSYAKLLRSHHPEEDPEGFQILKAAYDFAQKYANIKDDADAEKEEFLLDIGFDKYCLQNMRNAQPGNDRDESEDNTFYSNDSEARASKTTPEARRMASFSINNTVHEPDMKWIDDFLEKMRILYNDFFARCEAANWQRLLKDELFWNIEKKDALEPVIQAYLSSNRNLPIIVWQLFDDEYHWNDTLRELFKTNPAFAQIVLLETCRRWEINYSFVTRDSVFDYEKYLEFLRRTREAALENDAKRMKEYFHKAIEIYEGEPQIYRIVCEFLSMDASAYGMYRQEYQLALDKLIGMTGSDTTYYQMRGDLYARCEDYENAREDFLKAFELEPDCLLLLNAVAVLYSKQNMREEAIKCYKHIRKIYPQTKLHLEGRLEETAVKEELCKMIEENDKLIEHVRDVLKFKFDPRKHGPILFIAGILFWVLVAVLLSLL